MELAVLNHYKGTIPPVEHGLLDEMVRLRFICPHKLEMYAPASRSLVFRKAVLFQLSSAYQFLLGRLPSTDNRHVTVYHQGLFLLRILKPDEPNNWYRETVVECGKCFGIKEIRHSRSGHQCGYFLKIGPFWWVRCSKRLCCPGCFRSFSTAELGEYVSHILCDHASWGEPVEKFLLCSRDQIVHHLNAWYAKNTKNGARNLSTLSYAKFVKGGRFCYRVNVGRVDPGLRQDNVKEPVDPYVPHSVRDDFKEAVRGVQGFVNPDHTSVEVVHCYDMEVSCGLVIPKGVFEAREFTEINRFIIAIRCTGQAYRDRNWCMPQAVAFTTCDGSFTLWFTGTGPSLTHLLESMRWDAWVSYFMACASWAEDLSNLAVNQGVYFFAPDFRQAWLAADCHGASKVLFVPSALPDILMDG